MEFYFLTAEKTTPAVEHQIRLLFSQLSDNQAVSVLELLERNNPPLVAVCAENQEIIAMATMVIYDVISGKKAWIEDVVVDINFRGKGIGERLIKMLIEKANYLKINNLLLYSNPKREAAHRLYKRIGFQEKGSTLFIWKQS